MKSRALIAAVCLLAIPLLAEEDPANVVAKVDYNRILNSIGHQRVQMIGLDAEIKDELVFLHKKINQLVVDLVREEDEEVLQQLQQRQQLMQRKLSSIQSIIHSSRTSSSRDSRAALRKYVFDAYKDKYVVLLDTQFLSNSAQAVVITRGQATDITEEIIAALEEELP